MYVHTGHCWAPVFRGWLAGVGVEDEREQGLLNSLRIRVEKKLVGAVTFPVSRLLSAPS